MMKGPKTRSVATPIPSSNTPVPEMPAVTGPVVIGPYRRRTDSRRATILLELWKEGPISRGTLAERMNLNLPMVSACVQDLIRDGELIEEGYASSTGGRKAQLLDVNAKRGGVVAIEFNARSIMSASADAKGRLFNHVSRTIPPGSKTGDVIALLVEAVRHQSDFLREDEGIELTRIGLVTNGLVDEDNGISISIPGLAHWQNVPIAQMLSDDIGVPVALGRDIVAITLAEKVSGHYRDLTDLLVLRLGPGLGMGVVLGGEVHRGTLASVGDFGAVMTPAGALHTVAGGEALVERARARLASGEKSSIPRHVDDSGEITTEGIFRAADMGDIVAAELIDAAGTALGAALASSVAVLAPQAVLFGGTLVEEGDRLLRRMQESARQHLPAAMAESVRFEPASFGQQAGVAGAVALALLSHYNSFAD